MAEISTIARPYATAVFELAKAAKNYPVWTQQLHLLAAIVADPQARSLIGNAAVKKERIVRLAGRLRDGHGRAVRKLVVAAHDEGVKGVARIELLKVARVACCQTLDDFDFGFRCWCSAPHCVLCHVRLWWVAHLQPYFDLPPGGEDRFFADQIEIIFFQPHFAERILHFEGEAVAIKRFRTDVREPELVLFRTDHGLNGLLHRAPESLSGCLHTK